VRKELKRNEERNGEKIRKKGGNNDEDMIKQ
jgi:hypothetical protein